MDEAEAVLDRLARIDELRRARASSDTILEELRELLREADEWSLTEGGEDGRLAVAGLRDALREEVAPV